MQYNELDIYKVRKVAGVCRQGYNRRLRGKSRVTNGVGNKLERLVEYKNVGKNGRRKRWRLSGAAARTCNLYKNRVRRYIYNKDGGWDFKIKIFKFLIKL